MNPKCLIYQTLYKSFIKYLFDQRGYLYDIEQAHYREYELKCSVPNI